MTYEELEQRVKELEKEVVKLKHVEKELRETQKKWNSLAQNIPNFLTIVDRNHVIEFINHPVVGLELEEVISHSVYEFIQPEYHDIARKMIESVFITGQSCSYKSLATGPEGTLAYYNNLLGSIVVADEIIAVSILGLDITERNRSEEALRESEARFKEMSNLLPSIICEIDKNFHLTYANKVAFDTFGYSQADFDAGLNVINLIHPDDREKALKNINMILKEEKLNWNEYRMLRKDGSELIMLVRSCPIYKDGSIIGIRSSLTDITNRKMAEQALKEREKELETKTINLEEVNAALKALLKRREEDKKELEETVLSNMKELVAPYMEKFKTSGLNDRQINLLSVIESNLNDIVIPFSRHISMKYSNLTPKEIQVASLVKDGKTTKEIAEMLNSSTSAINFHRDNLRQKFGLKNKKSNLRSHLLSFM
jgi:PAS domain S-box-containing protein